MQMCEAACCITGMKMLEPTEKKTKVKYFVQRVFWGGGLGVCV